MIEHVPGGQGIRARVVRTVVRGIAYPVLSFYPLTGPLVRLIPVVDLVTAAKPRARSLRHGRVQSQTWRAEYVRPRRDRSDAGAVLYMHGGAFIACGLNSHRSVVERISARTRLPVLNVQYRQLPHGLLQESIDDCLDAYNWLVEQGFDPSRIVLAGDSAGGHLAFALALRLRDLGRPLPAAIVGFSPWLDFDHTTKIDHANAKRDHLIPAHRLAQAARTVVGSDLVHPELSPVNADLRGLPPVLLNCAADEVLIADVELMAQRLLAAGVPHRLQIWEGMIHAFTAMPLPVPEIQRSRDVAADFILEQLAAAAAGDVAAEVVA